MGKYFPARRRAAWRLPRRVQRGGYSATPPQRRASWPASIPSRVIRVVRLRDRW